MWWASRLATLTLVLAACSSSTSPVVTPPPTVAPTGQPATATPTGYIAFVSPAAPYRGCYPQTFEAKFDWVDLGVAEGDAFVGGRPGQLPVVVSIVVERAPSYDTSLYLSDVLANLRGAGFGVEQLDATTVDGVRAERLRFNRLTADGQRYTIQQVVWANGIQGWVASASSLPGDTDDVAALVATMLSCFHTGG